MSGVPFLAPFANRLDETAFYANGKKYAFDMTLGNVRGPIPIHGFVTTTDQWQVVEAKSDSTSAWVTSRVAIVFHPYYQRTDSPRDEWTMAVGAQTHWLLAPNKVPTGETEPIEKMFPNPRAALLRDYDLDDVFGDLVRERQQRATMSIA